MNTSVFTLPLIITRTFFKNYRYFSLIFFVLITPWYMVAAPLILGGNLKISDQNNLGGI